MSDSEDFMVEDESFGGGEDDYEESSDEENIQVTTKTKTVKKGATSASGKVNVLSETNTNAAKPTDIGNSKKTKTVEETYQKKSQLEHILLRPDTYIGSVEPHTQRMFVLDGEEIAERDITFTPGLYKIFDEIVVNAADNKQRDPNMDLLEIIINPEENTISVKNNGKGIPVVMHKEHNVYVPELIFGHLLTGSNFDDDEKKTTGGRNGYGAKLANVFSSKFIIECVDSERGLFYSQTFSVNMTVKGTPTVKNCTAAQKKKGDYVKITFSPELPRFKMTSLDSDTVALLSKRAYDMAGTMASSHGKKLSVTLNGKKLQVKSFQDYLKVFRGINLPVAYEKTDCWEVAVAASNDATMTHVSFVNAISTSKGGGHVSYIADQVAAHLQKTVKKKNKGGNEIKPAQIKNHLSIYVNCLVQNPAFDSQTKEFLTTKPKNFGTTCKLSDAFLKKLDKSDIVDSILAFASFKDRQALKRKGGAKKTKLTGITKLDDANYAGTAKSIDCTLIITEGDSAKSLAVSGLSVVGRDYYGVFPLRGKPLNVRDATLKQVTSNEEIKNLVDILGLKYGKSYDTENDLKTLRYGHLMVMADQDTDGSHIKGLIINLIHHFWPALLDRPGFFKQFITPIVKVSKGKQSITFFNLPEYSNWLEATGNDGKGWTIKYYKGLGTSTSAEAKEYFSNLDTHEVVFATLEDDIVKPDEDDELAECLPDAVASGSDMIDMVFRKTRVEDRKMWLNRVAADTFLDYSKIASEGVKYSDFINKEYVLFSRYDNIRSIPHLIDGFKPSQRKVLFGCFKRRLKGEVKVAQLTGYIAEHSAYHHGEQSLQGAIVGMAQNFCGSNNVNLLTPSGQFGTRRMGGKDAASARYIFTKLEPITRLIFHPDDDDLLDYLKDDGETIEPTFYVPVIPMVLVNGAEGIGTGWSSSVNNHDPRDIVANLRTKLNGGDFKPMIPYYYGFTGDIIPDESKSGSYSANGRIERIDDTTLHISELPIRKWTQDYKTFLEKFLIGDGKVPDIKDFRENHTDTTVSFTIIASKEKIDEFEKDKNGLMGKFKLTASITSSNMNLFDEEGRITKYEGTRDILNAFFNLRISYYEKRKAALLEKLRVEQRKLSNKARFVKEVCSGDLIVSNRKKNEILAELQSRGYELFFSSEKKEKQDSDDESDEKEEQSDSELAKGYDYLLGMKIWSLTFEKAEQLLAGLAAKTEALEELEGTSPSQIWLNDLDAIEAALDDRDETFRQAQQDEVKAQKKNDKRRAQTQKKQPKGKKKSDEWDSDEESLSDAEMEIVEVTAKDNQKAKRKPVTKQAAVKKPAPQKPSAKGKNSDTVLVQSKQSDIISVDSPTSEHESVLESTDLAEQMQSHLHVSPPLKKSKSKETKKRAASPVLEELEPTIAPKITQPAKAGLKKGAQVKKPVAAKAKKNTAASQKKRLDDSSSEESEDDFDFKSDDQDNEDIPPVSLGQAMRSRSARTRKPITYAMEEDSSDESFH
ncbi:hypothetical protein ACA910_001112 [Epithemia clementina (nom. ined.)]